MKGILQADWTTKLLAFALALTALAVIFACLGLYLVTKL